jgi:polysaccharide export outer membrane protein
MRSTNDWAPGRELPGTALKGWRVALCLLSAAVFGFAQHATEDSMRSTYVLGQGDQILVRVLDMDEMGKDPYQIDMRGNVSLPMAGRIHAGGQTPEELENIIAERLKKFLKNPEVSVTVHEMRSQPVSVLGEVKLPGVHQLQGEKTLLEVVSMAGGLSTDAGYSIRIARKKEWGPIPLPGSHADESGQYYVAEVDVKDLMEARSPEKNILVKPNDVVTVPKGELVYVLGAVKKSGGFVLGSHQRTTVLQALSMAEGLDSFAKSSNAKILRKTGVEDQRMEIAVNLSKILSGSSPDVPLQSDDILFVPINATKKAFIRSAEVSVGLGAAAIYRMP